MNTITVQCTVSSYVLKSLEPLLCQSLTSVILWLPGSDHVWGHSHRLSADVVPGEAKIANILFNMDFTWLQREPLKHSWSAELGLQARNQKLSSNQPSLCFPKDYFIFTEEIGIVKLHLELLTDSLSAVHCNFSGHHSHLAVPSQDPTEEQGSPHSTSCSLTVPIGQSVTSISSLINQRHKLWFWL